MTLYTSKQEGRDNLDLYKVVSTVTNKVWSNKKRKWDATEDYMRSIIEYKFHNSSILIEPSCLNFFIQTIFTVFRQLAVSFNLFLRTEQ